MASGEGGVETAPPRGETTSPAVDVALPARIDAIRIEGLVRTKPHVVRRELSFSEGDVITREALDLAVTRLWNTTIFARVDADVTREPGPDGRARTVVVIRLEDRWTLNPLFRFGSGGNAFFFRLGAADNNIAGRFLEVQGQYEYFDGFSGGQALFRDPRLFDRRIELLVQADRLVRPRQGFSDQRTQAIVEIAKLASKDRLRFALRASVFGNRFLAPLDSPRYFPGPTETLLVEPSFRVGRVDVVRIRQRGASVELRPGIGATTSDVASSYATMTGEALAFFMAGERWNFAFRFRAANVTRVPPHLEHWVGGLDLLRGFPDNFVRTRAFALGNVEARFTAFDSTWLAVVPTVFADAIAARSPAGPPGTALSVGGGVRLLIPKFVGSGLRADLAVPLHADLRPVGAGDQPRLGPVTPRADVGSLQPSFGVFQFF
ncbi:MAG: hypothetical protein KF795_33670 [Labilithrix sp.]|nr:hypothetical protein [Labilithrix sp.]